MEKKTGYQVKDDQQSEPTEAQGRVLLAFYQFSQAQGIQPTIRDLRELTGLKSTNTVWYHLHKLVQAGFMEQCGHARGIKITNNGIKEIQNRVVEGFTL